MQGHWKIAESVLFPMTVCSVLHRAGKDTADASARLVKRPLEQFLKEVGDKIL
jgi:hypothetical protein